MKYTLEQELRECNYYVDCYRKLLSSGFATLSAILITFAVSSLLHGLDLRMCTVLLSFGLFSFAETGALIHNYDQFQWDIWINEFKLFGHLLGLIMLLICILFDYSGIIKNAKQEKMQYKKE
uniref:Uncharacterized protein n=1 Tax=Meloidogyne javanica TaxID=6303 RepID=A0A915N2Q1_MELJA